MREHLAQSLGEGVNMEFRKILHKTVYWNTEPGLIDRVCSGEISWIRQESDEPEDCKPMTIMNNIEIALPFVTLFYFLLCEVCQLFVSFLIFFGIFSVASPHHKYESLSQVLFYLFN